MQWLFNICCKTFPLASHGFPEGLRYMIANAEDASDISIVDRCLNVLDARKR